MDGGTRRARSQAPTASVETTPLGPQREPTWCSIPLPLFFRPNLFFWSGPSFFVRTHNGNVNAIPIVASLEDFSGGGSYLFIDTKKSFIGCI